MGLTEVAVRASWRPIESLFRYSIAKEVEEILPSELVLDDVRRVGNPDVHDEIETGCTVERGRTCEQTVKITEEFTARFPVLAPGQLAEFLETEGTDPAEPAPEGPPLVFVLR